MPSRPIDIRPPHCKVLPNRVNWVPQRANSANDVLLVQQLRQNGEGQSPVVASGQSSSWLEFFTRPTAATRGREHFSLKSPTITASPVGCRTRRPPITCRRTVPRTARQGFDIQPRQNNSFLPSICHAMKQRQHNQRNNSSGIQEC
jgi:hypothetical protein